MRQKLFFFLLMACLLGLKASAQQAVTVKSFSRTTDHIPGGDRRNDLNGAPCALVKVQVTDDIVRVEGNKIGDILNRGVEKWFYMCKGSRNMRIHFKNHLPIRVNFRDYKINGLESNVVYELVLNTPDGPRQETSPQDVQTGALQLLVRPRNATVAIWGDNYQRKSFLPQDDGTLTMRLPYGRYYYVATADGYRELEGSVFVNDEDRWENVTMEVITGTLILECPMKKVEFYVDGQLVEKDKSSSMWMGQLEPGQHEVMAARRRYAPKTQTVTVTANQTTAVNFGELVSEFNQAIVDRIEKRAARKLQKEKEKAERQAAQGAVNNQEEISTQVQMIPVIAYPVKQEKVEAPVF